MQKADAGPATDAQVRNVAMAAEMWEQLSEAVRVEATTSPLVFCSQVLTVCPFASGFVEILAVFHIIFQLSNHCTSLKLSSPWQTFPSSSQIHEFESIFQP